MSRKPILQKTDAGACLCGSTLTSSTHDVELKALPGTIVSGLEHRVCPECGAEETVFPRLKTMLRELAVYVARMPQRLDGKHVRFLRKSLGWSQQDAAHRLGIRPETLSRWENGERPINSTAGRALRLLVLQSEPLGDYSSEDPLAAFLDELSDDPPSEVGIQAAESGFELRPR